MNFYLLFIVGVLLFQLWKLWGTKSGYSPYENKKIFSSNSYVTNVTQSPNLSEIDIFLKKINSRFDTSSLMKQFETLFIETLEAYTASHYKTLKMNLSKEVYESFSQKIEIREKKNLKLNIEVKNLQSSLQSYHKIRNGIDFIVRFASEQMLMTMNPQGESFDNPGRIFMPKIDIWVFRLLFKDQHLVVVETRSGKI